MFHFFYFHFGKNRKTLVIPKYIPLLPNFIYIDIIRTFIGYKSTSFLENVSSKCNMIPLGAVCILKERLEGVAVRTGEESHVHRVLKQKEELRCRGERGERRTWAIFPFLPEPVFLWLLGCVCRRQGEFSAPWCSVREQTHLKQALDGEAH